MTEMEGQMPLFSLDDCDAEHDETYEQETCEGPSCWCAPPQNICNECGTACTSSKECVQISGLYDDPA